MPRTVTADKICELMQVLHTMTLEVGYDSFEPPINLGTLLSFMHLRLSNCIRNDLRLDFETWAQTLS